MDSLEHDHLRFADSKESITITIRLSGAWAGSWQSLKAALGDPKDADLFRDCLKARYYAAFLASKDNSALVRTDSGEQQCFEEWARLIPTNKP